MEGVTLLASSSPSLSTQSIARERRLAFMDTQTLLLLLPIILIEFGFKAFTLMQVWRRPDLARSAQLVWTAAIVFISIFGWLAYMTMGRKQQA